MDQEPLHRGFAEFVGTFAVVFLASGALLITATTFLGAFAQGGGGQAIGFTLVAIALGYGLAVAVMTSALGHISGGHFNPVVTFAFLLARRISVLLAIVYWLMQFAAAALAALLLRWVFDEQVRNVVKLGAPVTTIDNWKAVVVEAVLTFFLVWVFFATAADPRGTFKQIAGLTIGLTVAVDVLVGGPLTGAAMNPARAFGPQLVQRSWDDWWIWYLGPYAGAAIAALVYEFLYLSPKLRPVLPVGPEESGVLEPGPGEAAVE
jgi:MIP family channel proteins